MCAGVVVAETTGKELVTLRTHHLGSTHIVFAPHDALLLVLQRHSHPKNPHAKSLPEVSTRFPHLPIRRSEIPNHDAFSSRHDHTRNS